MVRLQQPSPQATIENNKAALTRKSHNYLGDDMSIDETTTTTTDELLVQHLADATFGKIGRRTFFD